MYTENLLTGTEQSMELLTETFDDGACSDEANY